MGQAISQPAAAPTTDALIQQMNQRLEAQENEIAALRAQLPSQPTTAPATTTVASDKKVESELATQGKEILALQNSVRESAADADAGPAYPTLQFHGFGDINYHASSLKGDNNSVTLGEFDFFLGSQLSPDTSILSETVISADTTNFDSIEIERLMFSWNPNDYFNVDVGRYHTHVGYYNTEYHHGTWFQAATNRPFIDQFEDSGGIIPSHSVGMSIYGKVPGAFSNKLGLEYYVEWGNGHQ